MERENDNVWDMALGVFDPKSQAKPAPRQFNTNLPEVKKATIDDDRLYGKKRREANIDRLREAYYDTRNFIREQNGLEPLKKDEKLGTVMRLEQKLHNATLSEQEAPGVNSEDIKQAFSNEHNSSLA